MRADNLFHEGGGIDSTVSSHAGVVLSSTADTRSKLPAQQLEPEARKGIESRQLPPKAGYLFLEGGGSDSTFGSLSGAVLASTVHK